MKILVQTCAHIMLVVAPPLLTMVADTNGDLEREVQFRVQMARVSKK